MPKAVADQVATAMSHAKLRPLMKRLSVPEDASGLLARSSYLDCLVNEANRSKTQGTPLVVVLLELDKGAHWLRQLGDAALRKFMQQAGETVLAAVRPDYDPVDIATDVVNRAEFSLDEARQKGNAVVVR